MRTTKNPRRLLRSLLALVWPAFGAHAVWAGAKPEAQDGAGLLRAGRFTEAQKALTASVAARPRDPVALLQLGYLALLRNDLDEAARRLQAALDAKPNLKEGPALLAEAYYRRDDFTRAAPLFEKAGQTSKARKLASFAGRTPYQIEGTASIARLPFLKTDPLPIVSVGVNDSEPVRFLIDTGGGELILDRAFAEKVAAVRFGAERSYFAGGKQAAVEHGRVDSVRLGDFTVRHVPVNIMDLAAVGPALGEARIDGIIGTVLLYHFLSTIDYAGSQLTLERRDGIQSDRRPAEGPADGGISVPFWMAEDHFIVASGAINRGPQTLLFVDTGLAGGGFTCPPSTLKEAAIALRKDQAVTGTGGGGAFQVVPFVVDEISLGDVRRTQIDGVTGAFPPQLEWDLGFHIGGLISHQFFRPGALTLDFDAMRLRIRSPSAPASH
jgi:hypothetical protein